MLDLFNKPHSFRTIEANEFNQLLGQTTDGIVLDVRTPQEVAGGALQGAVNVDLNSPTFGQQIALLDPSKAYFVYCRSGMRSQQACELLAKEGFTTLYNLRGGLSAWPF